MNVTPVPCDQKLERRCTAPECNEDPRRPGTRVPVEALFELEAQLSEPLFCGVSVGATLGEFFNRELLVGPARSGLLERPMDWLRCCRHWLRQPQGETPRLPNDPGRFLLTWINEKPHCRDLVLPVVEALGSRHCHLIGRAASMEAQLPRDTGFMTWDRLPHVSHKLWRQEYGRCAPIWRRQIETLRRRYAIPVAIIPRLTDALIVQSQRVMSCRELLAQLDPRVIITEYDRNDRASCLVLAARARGIPTVTMIHGTINPPYGYTPLLADVALCWGEQHRDQMIALGTESKRLIVTGCQRITRALSADHVPARTKIGMPPERPLVLLATSPIRAEHRKTLARAFCRAFAGDARISAVVRVHPSETTSFYAEEIAAFPSVRFLANDAWTLDEALTAADVIVCHDSGLGNDALIKGKLTVVLDVLPVPLKNGWELVQKAGCPHVHSASELADVIDRVLWDVASREALKARAETYVRYFCAAFGAEAAANVARVVVERARTPA
jgi:hypothetical protein